jgi:peptide/nickel transport system substrate-binding protein
VKKRTICSCLLVFLLIAGILITGCTNTNVDGSSTSKSSTATQASVALAAETGKMLKFAELWLITGYDPSKSGVFITEKAIVTETLIGATQEFALTPQLATAWKPVSYTHLTLPTIYSV